MSQPSTHEVTQLLLAWSGGDRTALDKLTPLVYEELRRMAHRYMSRERPGHTMQTTALVNEAYLRLVNRENVHWQNRAHFFAIAAELMRTILVDHARSHAYQKRGGGARRSRSMKPWSSLRIGQQRWSLSMMFLKSWRISIAAKPDSGTPVLRRVDHRRSG